MKVWIITKNCRVYSFQKVFWYTSTNLEKNSWKLFGLAWYGYWNKCDALRDLVQFVQFKKCEKHPCRSVNFSKVAGFSHASATHHKYGYCFIIWFLQISCYCFKLHWLVLMVEMLPVHPDLQIISETWYLVMMLVSWN